MPSATPRKFGMGPIAYCPSLQISALALKVTEALGVQEALSAGLVCARVQHPPVAEPR